MSPERQSHSKSQSQSPSPPPQDPETMTSVLPRAPVQYYSAGLRGRFEMDAHRPVVQASPEQYVELGYEFDSEVYADRTEAILRAGGLERELPYGYPASLTGPMAWNGDDLSELEYVVQLSGAHKAEIEVALRHVLCEFM